MKILTYPTKWVRPDARSSEKQLPLSESETPFEVSLNENNCWVKLAKVIPWDEVTNGYYSNFHGTHRRFA